MEKKHYSKIKINLHLFVLILFILSISCKSDFTKTAKNHELVKTVEGNIFQDPILQTIYSLQDERNSTELLKYLTNEYPEYRKAAAMAFASVQDTMAILNIINLLSDKIEEVRGTAVYALGQIGHNSAENALLNLYQTETSIEVKRQILEAIGKCGTIKGLNFLCSLDFPNDDIVMLTGQAWGLSRYAMRNIQSIQSTAKAIELLTKPMISEKIRFTISHYFARASDIDLSEFYTKLVSAFNTDGYIYTKINITSALGKTKNIHALDFLHKILKEDQDYRIKINAINACVNFDYKESKDLIFDLLTDENANIEIKASEFFILKGTEADANKYFEYAKKISKWQPRTNMLTAACKYSKTKENISNSIISGYDVTENIYEKAMLLKALAGDPSNYKFVENQTFYTENTVISTAGMEALVAMRKHPEFDKYNKQNLAQKGENLYDEFALIFKKAIQSKDIALISIAAEALREPSFNYATVYSNTYFLTQALNNCQLPKEWEAYVELAKTIKYINGEDIQIPKISKSNHIDWDLVTSIAPNQKAIIKTTKGDITLQLLVNLAPGSVANFVRLVKEHYYDHRNFHRVVPNFVIQDGCNRGDGWGSAAYCIRSEFPQIYYEEGSVGMASSGKDTESVQWFITQYPTANLDGKYTIFATVIDGMEYVHQIEVGDKIISVEIQ